MAKAEISGKLTLDNNPFVKGLRKSEEAAKAAGSKIAGYLAGFATPLAALATALPAAFAASAIYSGVKGVFEMGRGMEELSDQTGISAGRLFMLGKAFRGAGLEAEDVGTVVNRLQKFIVNASETGTGEDVLSRLGTSALALRQMAPEQQLQAVGKAISAIRDSGERTKIAMELLGKSGGRVLGVFNSEAFAKAGGPLTGSAKVLEENADLFTRASIGLQRAGGLFRSFYLGIAEKVAGPFVMILDKLNEVDLLKLGEGFGDFIVKGATVFVSALNTIKDSRFLSAAKELFSTYVAGLANMWEGWSAFASSMVTVYGELGKLAATIFPGSKFLTSINSLKDVLLGPSRFFRDMMLAGAEAITAAAEKIKTVAAFLGFDTSGWDTPIAPAKPRPDGANSSSGGANAADPERIVINGSAWTSALDDTSETGRRMWQRRAGNPDDSGNGVEGAMGGLSGAGSDTAEAARQRLKTIREQVRFQDPHLAGGKLEDAVRAADKKQKDDEETRKYRELHGSPLGDDSKRNDAATVGEQQKTTNAVKELKTELAKLFAQ